MSQGGVIYTVGAVYRIKTVVLFYLSARLCAVTNPHSNLVWQMKQKQRLYKDILYILAQPRQAD